MSTSPVSLVNDVVNFFFRGVGGTTVLHGEEEEGSPLINLVTVYQMNCNLVCRFQCNELY